MCQEARGLQEQELEVGKSFGTSQASTGTAETEVRQERDSGLKGCESLRSRVPSHQCLTNRDNVQVHHCANYSLL